MLLGLRLLLDPKLPQTWGQGLPRVTCCLGREAGGHSVDPALPGSLLRVHSWALALPSGLCLHGTCGSPTVLQSPAQPAPVCSSSPVPETSRHSLCRVGLEGAVGRHLPLSEGLCLPPQDPYFMKNHLGSYECKLCLTLHNNEVGLSLSAAPCVPSPSPSVPSPVLTRGSHPVLGSSFT